MNKLIILIKSFLNYDKTVGPCVANKPNCGEAFDSFE